MADRAVVTGASGFIGWHLARRLASHGWDVHVLARPTSPRPRLESIAPGVTVHQHDGTSQGMVDLLCGIRPSVVFHLASLFLATHTTTDVSALISSNVLFGTQLLQGMAEAGTPRLVNTGTSWQYDEHGAYQPVCLYAATKQAFEDVARFYSDANGIECVTLKLFDTYGPNDPRPKLFNLLCKAAVSQEHLKMSPGEQLLDLVYIDDVVEAFVLGATLTLTGDDPLWGDYAVSAGQRVALKELVATFSRVTGKPINVEWGGRPYRAREVMVPWSHGTTLPGWRPQVSLENGIRRTLEAYEGGG